MHKVCQKTIFLEYIIKLKIFLLTLKKKMPFLLFFYAIVSFFFNLGVTDPWGGIDFISTALLTRGAV